MRLSIALAASLGLLGAPLANAQSHCATRITAPGPKGAPPLLSGLGSGHHPITTKVPEAQAYFDQGLRLVYAFNHDEAIRDFEEAARRDPTCAMCHWGIALALGPNINLPMDSERAKRAAAESAEASRLAPDVGEGERAFIAALAKRYSAEPGADRAALDRAYADAMRTLAASQAKDVDAQVLFAEALMDLRPWDFWTHDGKPQPGTEEALAAIQRALALAPDHLGANHYLIHLVEGSTHPERGLEAAAKLPRLAPGAGHLVHMPAHIYMRTGRYAEASDANERAIAADRKYLAQVHAEGIYASMYVAHNFHFLWASALMEGRSKVAMQAARDVTARLPVEQVRAIIKESPGVDGMLAVPLYAMVRFGKWDEILAAPTPPADLPFLNAGWHFARGMAFAAQGKAEAAAKEQAALDAFVGQLSPQVMLGPTNSARAVYGLAQAELAGQRAAAAHDWDAAVKALQDAVSREDALGYDEPPPWFLPARHLLGAVLLEAGRQADAERVYREDLERNPENGWSLLGLSKATSGTAARDARKRFERAWRRADVKPSSSRF